MPNVQSLLAGQGTSFNEAYISFPLCCPSRATMMSGQYMHNHGVHGNIAPNGSWFKFRSHESNDLPVWLQDDGYYNVHIGKYMNGYGVTDNSLPVPPGWSEWYGKISEDALYFNPADREDRAERHSAPHLLRRSAGRLPDRRLRGSSRQLHQRQGAGQPALLAQPLVQLAARSVRPGPQGPLQAFRDAAAEAARVQREEHQRQAQVVPQAGEEAADEEAGGADRQ